MRSPPTAGRFAWTRPASFAALCLAAFLTTVPGPAGAEPPRQLTGNVDKVLDGDTLVVAGERVRLWGIDAPETRQACEGRDGVVYLCGQMAAKAMRELARAGPIDCEVRDVDRYGRSVARCSLTVGRHAGADLAATLVAQGWALDYPRYSRRYYAAAEAGAQAGQLGMWSGRFERPWDWRRSRK